MVDNGELKIILIKLDKIDVKMDKMFEKNAQQDLSIGATEIRVKSTQTELTEHKTDHRWNNVFILSVASFFSGLVAWIISFVKK